MWVCVFVCLAAFVGLVVCTHRLYTPLLYDTRLPSSQGELMMAAGKCRKNIILAQLARTLTEWHCNSFTDLIDEMGLWDWNIAHKDFWSQLAKSLDSQKVSVTWAEKMDKKIASVLVPEKMSWATATRSIRKCKTRIEKIGGSRVDTEPTAWGLNVQVWNLLRTGEEAMK